MINKLGCAIAAACQVLAVHAVGYFSEAELKAAYPELFIPGRVGVVTNADVVYYVYSGGARMNRLMDAPRMKTIATLRAEDALARYVRGTRKTDVVIRLALQVAKVVGKSEVTYVFAVPVSGVAEVAKKGLNDIGNAETNKDVRPKADNLQMPTRPLLELIDDVDRNPENVDCRIALAEAYFSSSCYDEATGVCEWIVNRLAQAKELKEREIDVLAKAAEISFSLGEYRLSRKAFARIRDVSGSRYHPRALQALSEIQLRLGIE